MEVGVEVEELTRIDVGFESEVWLVVDLEDCFVVLEFVI